ncbi:hypothetical protein ACQP2P_02330 [Dactylosporangium sp. CA-139114]|uniref:hypothetical protein n=1 Tax=Dactylosporangium sp. CA-139114 TaxID=3239931 RepID=UPI003D965431
MRFDRALHETVEEMTGGLHPLPADFAGVAMARGRRIRRRRRVAAGAGALAAVVGILLPFALRHDTDRRAHPPAVASAGPVHALPGGWRLMGAGRQALNAQGAYVQLGSGSRPPVVAPAGYRALRQDDPADPPVVVDVNGDQPAQLGAADLVGGLIRWSPTGDRLVSAYLVKDTGESGFAIFDARTGQATRHAFDHTKYDCSQCELAFTRDGREVYMTVADRSLGEAGDLPGGLQFFDAATGAPTRSVPARVWTAASAYAFSPDGRYLVAPSDRGTGQYRRVDLTTGRSETFSTSTEAVWVDDNTLLAPVGNAVAVLRPDGNRVSEWPVQDPDLAPPFVLGPPA